MGMLRHLTALLGSQAASTPLASPLTEGPTPEIPSDTSSIPEPSLDLKTYKHPRPSVATPEFTTLTTAINLTDAAATTSMEPETLEPATVIITQTYTYTASDSEHHPHHSKPWYNHTASGPDHTMPGHHRTRLGGIYRPPKHRPTGPGHDHGDGDHPHHRHTKPWDHRPHANSTLTQTVTIHEPTAYGSGTSVLETQSGQPTSVTNLEEHSTTPTDEKPAVTTDSGDAPMVVTIARPEYTIKVSMPKPGDGEPE